MTPIEVLVRGPLAESTADLIASRFTALTVSTGRSTGDTLIEGEMDQSAERALLALLWDTGHDVIELRSSPPGHQERSRAGGDDHERPHDE